MKTGATNLFARKPFAQILALLLSAFLAWPSCVPYPALESAAQRPVDGRSKAVRASAGFHNRERKSVLDDHSWSDLSDNVEGSDSRDEFSYMPLAFGVYPLDLPSLVPMTLEFCDRSSVDGVTCFWISPPLRC